MASNGDEELKAFQTLAMHQIFNDNTRSVNFGAIEDDDPFAGSGVAREGGRGGGAPASRRMSLTSETEDLINSSRKSKRASLLRQSLTGSLVPKRLRRSKVKPKPPRSAFDNVESIEDFLTDEIGMNSEMVSTCRDPYHFA